MDASATPILQRFCPSCGERMEQATCPHDGATTVERVRLDGEGAAVHAGDLIGGRYLVTGTLGRGGFGAVYAAEHTGTRQKIALKMLHANAEGGDAEDIRRFYREAQITANLSHPNTVRVFDVGKTETGALYIAMERVHGPTLEHLLRARNAAEQWMNEAEALDIAMAVLSSLSEAHGQGLVHRDLKPGNIALTQIDGERVVKVLDFGIARQAGSSLTDAGRALGTPAYMSPEQCQAQPLDGRSDLYSLGVILFRCVAGKLPFADANPMAGMFCHASLPPPDLSSAARTPVTEAFVACVMRALAKDPSLRYESARAMRAALEQARRQVPAQGGSLNALDVRELPVTPAEPGGADRTQSMQPVAIAAAPGLVAAELPEAEAVAPPRHHRYVFAAAAVALVAAAGLLAPRSRPAPARVPAPVATAGVSPPHPARAAQPPAPPASAPPAPAPVVAAAPAAAPAAVDGQERPQPAPAAAARPARTWHRSLRKSAGGNRVERHSLD